MQENNNISPFSRYRLGYLDGYEGIPIRMYRDSDYIRGYEAGTEDDTMGAVNRFSED
jgi:hypothetical protein